MTEVTTITAQPGTVTVALQGPDAIASSLNSAISIESQQIEINSQLAPINPLTSGRPPTTTSVAYFTRTIIVPVVEATKTSVPDGQSPVSAVYFIGESNGTTSWLSDFTPVQSMTIGTTTVTLSPVPASSRNPVNGSAVIQPATRTEYSTRTTTWQGTSSAAARAFSTSVDYQGWNSSRLDPAASGYSTSQGYSNIPSSFRVSTVRRTSAVTTSTVYVSASLTSGSLPTNAHGSTANITFPTANYGSQKRSAEDLRRRAVCEWVTVTMRGIPATWRNNWDGSKTVNCATVPMSTESALRMYGELKFVQVANNCSSTICCHEHSHCGNNVITE